MKDCATMMEAENGEQVRIKVEPLSPPKVQANTSASALSKYASITVRKDLGGRLPSFKPPRDLTLTGASSHYASLKVLNPLSQTKKVFLPNVNVTRRKGPSVSTAKGPSLDHKQSEKPRRNNRSKGNFVQTQGVFSEGLAPGKPRAYNREHDATPSTQLEKPKLNLNRVYDKKKEEGCVKDLLKDDFLDDPKVLPDITDCPKSLPLHLSAKRRTFQSLDETFEALQVKKEKGIKHLKDEGTNVPDLVRFFTEPSTSSRIVVFDFPEDVRKPEPVMKKPSSETKKDGATKVENVPAQVSCNRLSAAGEGLWGSLRVMDDGSAYVLVGKEKIPVTMTRHCPRQEVMSVNLDSAAGKGEIINLGPVCANFKCSTDLSFLDEGP